MTIAQAPSNQPHLNLVASKKLSEYSKPLLFVRYWMEDLHHRDSENTEVLVSNPDIQRTALCSLCLCG